MRDLIISIICILILIIPWGIYDRFSTNTVEDYKSAISDEILPAIENNDWNTAEKRFDYIAKDWDKYKKISAFFIDTESVNEVDSYVSKAYYYIKLKDAGNAAAEAAFLQYRFDFLHENELPNMGNIF